MTEYVKYESYAEKNNRSDHNLSHSLERDVVDDESDLRYTDTEEEWNGEDTIEGGTIDEATALEQELERLESIYKSPIIKNGDRLLSLLKASAMGDNSAQSHLNSIFKINDAFIMNGSVPPFLEIPPQYLSSDRRYLSKDLSDEERILPLLAAGADGDGFAYNYLGSMFEAGFKIEGVQVRDTLMAARFYYLAIKQGNKDAKANLDACKDNPDASVVGMNKRELLEKLEAMIECLDNKRTPQL
ncbi:MAG: hypothetical protein LBG48_04590 [Rickettsiales bacterium]|nr:hypothetical protein [Rickettsiales bacterium]